MPITTLETESGERQWRLHEGRWPSPSSPNCLLLQFRSGTEWTSKAALKADGTFVPRLVFADSTAPGTQVIANNTTTALDFSVSGYGDTDKAVSGPPWLFKVPANAAGLYRITCWVQTTAGAAAGNGWMTIRQNGTNGRSMAVFPQTASVMQGGSMVVKCAVGDTLEMLWTQTSGGNTTIGSSSYIQIERIADF